MTDISAFGTHFDVWTKVAQIELRKEDLALDGNPLEISPIRSANMEIDLSGKPVTYTIRQPYEVSIALIPGSPSDVKFRDLLYASRDAGEENTYAISQFIVYYPSGECIQFQDGRVTNGVMSAGVNSDGHLTGGRYNMSFAYVTTPYGNKNGDGKNIYCKYTDD